MDDSFSLCIYTVMLIAWAVGVYTSIIVLHRARYGKWDWFDIIVGLVLVWNAFVFSQGIIDRFGN